MSYRIARELSSEVTAVAAFIANMPLNNECVMPTKAVPMLIMNSTIDPFMPWLGGSIKSKGGKVTSSLTTFEFWLKNNASDVNQIIIHEIKSLKRNSKTSVNGKCYQANQLIKQPSAKSCFYQVHNGGHIAPSISHKTPYWIQKTILGLQNQDLESADLAWNFFDSIKY